MFFMNKFHAITINECLHTFNMCAHCYIFKIDFLNATPSPSQFGDEANNRYFITQERNQKLKSRASQLDKQINVLISDSVALLKARMTELGIHASNTVDLLARAKEIVGRHKELQSKASKLQAQVIRCPHRPFDSSVH